jgi:hypothetical protein
MKTKIKNLEECYKEREKSSDAKKLLIKKHNLSKRKSDEFRIRELIKRYKNDELTLTQVSRFLRICIQDFSLRGMAEGFRISKEETKKSKREKF